MSSLEKKYLESMLKPCLKKHGFRKKGGTWWKRVPGFIQVVNIQGSQFAKTFYLNLGVYIEALGEKQWPAEYYCHVRTRLETIAEDDRVLRLLDFEHFDSNDPARQQIATILENYGLPWLGKCASYEGAKAEYQLPNRVMTAWQRAELDAYFA